MKNRISPLWWPLLTMTSPLLVPFLAVKNKRFRQNRVRAEKANKERVAKAQVLDLPELDYLELTVLVEEKTENGFIGDAGVSYLFKSNLGSLLFDVGFGPERPALSHNLKKLGLNLNEIEALAISHLHPDHMGGVKAMRDKNVILPYEMKEAMGDIPCYLPDKASAENIVCEVVEEPRLLSGGIATTGPLARSLFFFGYTEEQVIVARIKGKGLVVITSCGHPTVAVIAEMVSKISNEPIYVFGGGLHFPVTGGRGNRYGIQFQTIVGTGKPLWQRITNEELLIAIEKMNKMNPEKIFLSAHDSCDYSLQTMKEKLTAKTEILKAGATYCF